MPLDERWWPDLPQLALDMRRLILATVEPLTRLGRIHVLSVAGVQGG